MYETSAHRKSALSASCIAHMVQDGLSSAIFVLLPVLAQAFGLTYAQVGLMKGLNNASQAILEFGSGWFAERVGEVRLLVFGMVLTGVGYLCLTVAPGVFLIAACLILIGAGTALHHAPSSSLIANGYPQDKRSGALGFYNATGDVGKLIFTGCFSLGVGAGLAWYQVSFLFGLTALLASGGIAFVGRSLLHTANSEPREGTETRDPETATRWGILNGRSFGALLVATSIDTVVQTGLFVFTAFLMLAKGLPLSIATGATIILLTGGVFGKAGCGYLADRIGAHRAFVLAQVLTALGIVAVIVAPNWFALIALFPLGAVAQGSTSITYGFAASLIHPHRMARGYALLYSTGTFGAAVGPLAFGWIADAIGIETALFSMAVIVLFSIVPMLLLPVAHAPHH